MGSRSRHGTAAEEPPGETPGKGISDGHPRPAKEAGSGAPSDPVVSVILPTRDRLPFLREAVDSVLRQTFPGWELVVADHGSSDGTRAWLESLGDARVRVLGRPRAPNPAALRNAAIDAARGRYLAFLDSDDLWEPRKLEIHLERMGAAVAADGGQPAGTGPRWSYSAVTRIDPEGRVLPARGIRPWRAVSGVILRELLEVEAILATPAVVAERTLVREAGGFDASLPFCEDYDLWLRLAARSEVLAIPEPLARVRVHSDNYSADRAAVHACWVRVYRKAGSTVGERALRRVCRAREREHATTRAALLAKEGARGTAFLAVTRVLARHPGALRAWRVLVGHVLLSRGE